MLGLLKMGKEEDKSKMAQASALETKNPKKEKPANLVIPPKQPKLSKAERRAQQEKQRAEKAAASAAKTGGKKPPDVVVHVTTAAKPADAVSATSKTKSSKSDNQTTIDRASSNTVQLFDHLPTYNDIIRPASVSLEVQAGLSETFTTSDSAQFHPAILQLAIAYREGTIMGGNKRCRAMLRAFQQVIKDYEIPVLSAGKRSNSFTQDLDYLLRSYFTFLTKHSRPHSTSMGNAFTFLKLAILNLHRDISLKDAKRTLREQIDAYIRERIRFADEAIANHAITKIHQNDVILVYGHSEVVEVLLRKAFRQLSNQQHKTFGEGHQTDPHLDNDFGQSAPFRVIVVDSRPLMEGRDMLRALREEGIPCTYILLNAVSYVMSSSKEKVTKVFIGASALMSNGAVQSRVGTYAIALLAQSCNVPVLVCCETYKISNRVQLESITGNELGNPDWGVASTHTNMAIMNAGNSDDMPLKNWRTTPNLKLLNILYDLTPSEFVSGIVTEMGILPPTSVAVILREMNPQDNTY